jgi:hypothetical protein
MENRMSTPVPNPVPTKSPLEAAQKIVAELQGMTGDHQTLAVKFAMETLGLQLPTGYAQAMQAPPHTVQPPVAESAAERADIKTFTAAKSPKSDQQFAAVVAYFYQFEAPAPQRKNSIDAATMKDAARQAGREQVKNWNTTLTNALRSGYLDKAERGAFKLNSVGENLVAITLPGNASGGQSNGGGSKKKRAKKGKLTSKKTAKHG